MSRLNDIIRQVANIDEQLAKDLKRETDALADRRAFGLNFERHVPEAVELPGRPVRKNDKVRVLPPRGEMPTKANDRLWRVDQFATDDCTRVAHLVALDDADERQTVAVDDLVVVAEFRDPIYPGLVSTGKVQRGGDKPFHTVINAENYHALQALLFTHRGKVDAIYIDPPYNTGAKDWKYNNDYVEADDHYRHSKWLAFMERRLLLAKELLNPADAVLIVTIDEKESARLALLLEQVFPEAVTQMVSSVIKPGGTSRSKLFSRVEEYIYFVFFGVAEVKRTGDPMLSGVGDSPQSTLLKESDLWEGMVRRGIGVVRSQRPKQFYPIFIDSERGAIVAIGDAPPLEVNRDAVEAPDGLVPVWPIKDDGTEGFWQLSPPGLRRAMERGTARVGSFNRKTGQWRIQYMKAQKARYIDDGTIAVRGKDANGVVILELGQDFAREKSTARTVWTKASHDASVNGAGLLNKCLPGRKFPFPKSLFAVEDALRFFIADKPDATVVDFFAGSGTTAHAVFRLNRQDGGARQSITITNNEASSEEQIRLRRAGLRPGDTEWDAWGISEYVTKPRIEAAITGVTPGGEPIKGVYRFNDEFPIADGFEENVEFFTLTYESPMRVSSNREFAKIAPLLWMRAGSSGRRIDDISPGWDVADTYGVIANLDYAEPFVEALNSKDGLTHAFIVTDEDRLFEGMVRQLPDHVEPVRLYSSYLRNFEIEAGRASR